MEKFIQFVELQKELLERAELITNAVYPPDSLFNRYITLDEKGAHISHQYVYGDCSNRFNYLDLTPEELMTDIPTITAELKRRKEEEESERMRFLQKRDENYEEALAERLAQFKQERDNAKSTN